MESVTALIAALRTQQTALLDASHRLQKMRVVSSELLRAVNIADAALSSEIARARAALAGGAGVLDPRVARSKPKALSWPEHILDCLKTVEGAWPFIRSNVELAVEACTAALSQADVTERLALPLNAAVAHAQATGDFSKVSAVSLSAFNGNMAHLAARVSALEAVIVSLALDMKDALEIFETLAAQVSRLRERMSPTVTRGLDAIISSSSSLIQLAGEVKACVRRATVGVALLHPDIVTMGASSPRAATAVASSPLAEAAANLAQLSNALRATVASPPRSVAAGGAGAVALK